MKRIFLSKRAEILGTALWLGALGPCLGACSADATKLHDILDDQHTQPHPSSASNTLVIEVRNESSNVRYLGNPGTWMRSDTATVRNFDAGDPEPDVPMALYSNQPTCQQIVDGTLGCGAHGDSAGSALALAPGATLTDTWSEVWKRGHISARPDCICVEPVAPPNGIYRVNVSVGSEVTCVDDPRPCDPGDASCITYGCGVVADRELEQSVSFPFQDRVVLVLE